MKTISIGLLALIVCLICSIPVSAAVSAPVASFVTNATSGNTPLGIQFIDTSTNTPTSWAWSFGDGYTSVERNPLHVYSNAGSFTVTFTATNSGGSNTVTQSGYITATQPAAVPVASFISTVTSGDAPLTVQFIDASTNTPTSWAWSFGDGGTSILQNPAHTYATTGAYTVTLTATNAEGSNTVTKAGFITVVRVATKPVAAFVSTSTSGNAPLTVQFIDSSSNSPTTWAWLFGDGSTSSLQNPAHAYTSAGTYTVTLTVANSGGSNTMTRTDYITVDYTIPVAAFTANSTAGSAPFTVQFTDASEYSPTSWYWNFGDGSTSTEQNKVHTYQTAGTYSVSLTAINSKGNNRTVITDFISVTGGTPLPDTSFTSDIRVGAVPFTVQFTDTSTNSPTKWEWSFGDGETSALQNPAHTYQSAGTYTIKLTATNGGGSNSVTRKEYIVVTATSVSAQTTAITATPTITGATPTPAVNQTALDLGSLPSWVLPVILIILIAGIALFALHKIRHPATHGRKGRRDL
jgi:PKD repeat protein